MRSGDDEIISANKGLRNNDNTVASCWGGKNKRFGAAMETDRSHSCKLYYKRVAGSLNIAELSDIVATRPSATILGGNAAPGQANRFSYWAAEPQEVFEFRVGQDNPFGKLRKTLEKYRLEGNVDTHSPLQGNEGGRDTDLPPGIFLGGWAGYFSYELGRYTEKLPQKAIDDIGLPLLRLCFYDKLVCYDEVEGCCWLLALRLPGESERPTDKLRELEHLVWQARRVRVEPLPSVRMDRIDLFRFGCNMSREYYLRAVKTIKEYIYDGDVYQVNFAQRYEGDYRCDPIALYHWQNCYNPSPFAAYIAAPGFDIVSASPEMFIAVQGGRIRTQPIKGTRPRLEQTGKAKSEARLFNAKKFEELLQSEKERAELAMIIDLERNDLGRICEYGSVQVVQPRTIACYPTVFHGVATIEGRLRPGIGFDDILMAMFPGGSITGVPKVRSMEIIDELEPTQRSVYTGCIGFIGVDGTVCLNIAIRTAIVKARRVFVQAGGGIVVDSIANAEWEETITKARALLAGVHALQRARN